jgi:hypothetical protein
MADITPKTITPVNSEQWAVSNSAPAPNPSYSGTFIPALWSGKLAKKFYKTTIFGEIANTDWEGEIKNLGDHVIINTIPTLTTKEYKVGQKLEYEVPVGETFDLLIDQARYFAVNVNDVMAFQSKIPLMENFTNDATQQMKIYVDKQVIYQTFFDKDGAFRTNDTGKGALWNKNCGANAGAESASYNLGTDAAPVALTADNILSYITLLSTVLDEANVPEDGRYLVITPKERQILMMSPLAQAQFMGDSTSILRNGRIGSIDRFSIYVSNNLPRAAAGKAWNETGAAADGKKRHLIFAGHKSGISFASQITKMETLQNPNDFGRLVRGLQVWGSMVSQGQALAPMVVADA